MDVKLNKFIHLKGQQGDQIGALRALIGGANPKYLLYGAICGGHHELVRLAQYKMQIRNQKISSKERNYMLFLAAESGHLDICQLIRQWGSTDINYMLAGAAKGGYPLLCQIAKENGADDYDLMICLGAWGGFEAICQLSRKWGRWSFIDYNKMLYGAARGGNPELALMAKKWGAKKVNKMLYWAAVGGKTDMCRLAIQWGANKHDHINKGVTDSKKMPKMVTFM